MLLSYAQQELCLLVVLLLRVHYQLDILEDVNIKTIVANVTAADKVEQLIKVELVKEGAEESVANKEAVEVKVVEEGRVKVRAAKERVAKERVVEVELVEVELVEVELVNKTAVKDKVAKEDTIRGQAKAEMVEEDAVSVSNTAMQLKPVFVKI